MSIEGALFGLLVAAACLPAVSAMRRKWPGVVGCVVLGLLAAPAASMWTDRKADDTRDRVALDERPIEVRQDGYVSSDTCKPCHPGPYTTWHASFHRTMTQFATPETVAAPFAGEELIDESGMYRLQRSGDEFRVEMPDPAWRGDPAARPRVSKRIVMITGSHHYQVYWFPSGNTRVVWVLPFIWMIEEQRWITRGAAFLGPAERTKHILGVWNNSCIKCHSTRGRPGPDASGGMDTRVAEIGIACEACHGPAEEHVRLHRDPRARYRLHASGQADPSIVNPARLSHTASAQVCGQCHGVWRHDGDEGWRDWMTNGLRYRPGDDLEERVLVLRFDRTVDLPRMREFEESTPSYRMERQFWRDGQVRVSGREYNGLLDTPCYQKGRLTCVSCHRLHRDEQDPRTIEEWRNDLLGASMEEDEACLDCHASYANDVRSHTHHEPGSSGSLCYNCHMPYTTYGLLKAIRSHEIDSPTVSASLRSGRPNACNQCHLNETLAWTARYLDQWYEMPSPRLPPLHREVAASVVWSLSGDAGQRALMAWSMGWPAAREISKSGWMAPYLAQLLDDPYEAVRLMAHRSLRTLPGYEDFDYDFLAPPTERAAARLRALELWRHLPGKPDDDGAAAVLVDDRGVLREDLFYPLLARRDERVVELHE